MDGVGGIGKFHLDSGRNVPASTRSVGGDAAAFDVLLEQALEDRAVSLSDEIKPESEKLQEAAQEMEAIVIQQMLKAMRDTVPEGEGIFAKSNAQKTFESMLDVEYARIYAQNANFGLADAIYRQLSQYIEEDE